MTLGGAAPPPWDLLLYRRYNLMPCFATRPLGVSMPSQGHQFPRIFHVQLHLFSMHTRVTFGRSFYSTKDQNRCFVFVFALTSYSLQGFLGQMIKLLGPTNITAACECPN